MKTKREHEEMCGENLARSYVTTPYGIGAISTVMTHTPLGRSMTNAALNVVTSPVFNVVTTGAVILMQEATAVLLDTAGNILELIMFPE